MMQGTARVIWALLLGSYAMSLAC